MVLYTCTDGKILGDLPAPIAHPCGRAAKALDDAGHSYDWKKVKGGRVKFWTWPSRAKDRAEIERLSGQRAVPILVLDAGEVVVGSGAIARWARENRPQVTSPAS
jgi:glutathione S-transferase